MKYVTLSLCLLFACLAAVPSGSAAENKTPTIEEKTAGLKKYDGYFPFYWDEHTGKVWLEVHQWGQEFLYIESLPAGVGSNDIGLDRGQLGASRIVRFERSGPKVLLVEPNYAFRASSDNAEERRSVQDAFAQSVLWGFTVEAQDGDRVLVDATAFFLRDAHDVAGALARAKQGTFHLDQSRAAFYLDRTRNFPRNTEVEATLTFTTDAPPGQWVREVTPTPAAITVREHHSLAKLPGPGYTPRVFAPGSGFYDIRYMDFAAPLGEPVTKRFIARHRLQKKDPSAALSDPVEPIVYYLDPGVPEPVRSALLEGASWWNQAFEAAGYRNAFQVKVLPAGADPMDIRYNVINWVHRSSRGWSYGGGVIDPRTGEIIKGQVTLGSLRLRQDYLIAESLLAPYKPGQPAPAAMRELALARVRQLAAHEVGHTLGLAHNFAASVNGRASVMDYPHPLVKLAADGRFDLSDSYASGIGEWDKVTIAYGYSDFPAGGNEPRLLRDILAKAQARGLQFITDEDSRPAGGAHPQAHLWDNGTDAVDELQRIMKVRARALDRFSADNIREGQPMSTLQDVLVPVYMVHRYQVEAASKVLGGLYYTYALRGDGETVTAPVPGAEQRRALDALLATIQPEALALPEKVLRQIPPPAFGYNESRERFKGRTGLTFDALAPAESAANLTVQLLLNSDRAARLVEYHSRDAGQPGLIEVIDKLLQATWKTSAGTDYHGEIQRAVNNVVLYQLAALMNNENARAQVRSVAALKLAELRDWLTARERTTTDESQRAHYAFAAMRIRRWLENPGQLNFTTPAEPPPGQPIGEMDDEFPGGSSR